MERKNSDMSKQRADLQSVSRSYRNSRDLTGVPQLLWELYVGLTLKCLTEVLCFIEYLIHFAGSDPF